MTDLEMYQVFLPQAFNPHIPFSGGLGAQVDGILTTYEDHLAENRTYQSPLRWFENEMQPGVYTGQLWLVNNVTDFRREKSSVILGAKNCPARYAEWNAYGAPPKPEYYNAYAEFLAWAAEYYAPDAFELFNEPDVPNTIDNATQYWYGAWVENDDYYGAGRKYGNMTKVVAPVVRNHGCKVIAGAMFGDPPSLDFLRGMVDAGVDADYISFHCYIWDEVSYPKIFNVANQMRALIDLPFIVTETNVCTQTMYDNFYTIQAGYMRYLKELLRDRRDLFHAIEVYNMYGMWNFTALITGPEPTLTYEEWLL